MAQLLIFSILILAAPFVYAEKVPGSCFDLFTFGSPTHVRAEFQRALNLGKEMMRIDSSQREALLSHLYPDGFLIHGTATPVVELAIRKQGKFFGSKSISSQYWAQSTEINYARTRKNLSEYSTLYFHDSHSENSLRSAFLDANVYADLSGTGFHVLKKMGLEVERYAELTHIMASIVHGEWTSLDDVYQSGDKYFSTSQNSKIGEILNTFGELTPDIYRESAQRRGVILILSRGALKRVRSYLDPETGSRFFLLPPGKSLSISDVRAIFPLSEVDLNDLEAIDF